MTVFSAKLASLGGVGFVLLLVAAFATLAAVGTVDGAPAAEWGEAIERNGRFAQLSGFLHALAGVSLACFVVAADDLASSPRGARSTAARGARSTAARGAGLAWAASFVIGGAVIFAAAELAGYQSHPEGAKTALALGHLLYANPIAAFLASLFALAVGSRRAAAFPAWFRPFSLAAGGLGLATTLLGSVGGIGLVGMGPVALWLLVAAVLVPARAFPRAEGASAFPAPK